MELFSDDINLGYRTILMMINNEHTLIDKLQDVREIEPDSDFEQKGGVGFHCVLKGSPTGVELVMNNDGSFNITTVTIKGLVQFQNESVDTLINYLHLFYVNMKDDEDKLLSQLVDPYTYRKAAKKMHYRERYDN